MIKSKITGHLFIITLVILNYFIFALPNIKLDSFTKLPQTPYQFLTAGFLLGQLSLPAKPSDELLQLPNPYDVKQQVNLQSYKVAQFYSQFSLYYDLSLYQKKYYLYFGPLPVITFFMPFKLLTTFYPPPALAIFFFISIGFIFNFLLLIKIKKNFPKISNLQLNFLGLVMGLANDSPFLFFLPRMYEVAVASSYCLMSIALFYMYDCLIKFKTKQVCLFSICLSLTVAGRPHFALVIVFLLPVIAYYLLKYAPKNQIKNLLVSLFLPVLCVGVALAAYNYLRFHSFSEFGHRYQLSMVNYLDEKIIRTDFYRYIPLQIYYYFIQPFFLNMPIPPIPHWMEGLSRGTHYDPATGILTTAPLVFFILITRTLFKINAKNDISAPRPLLWFLRLTLLATGVIVFFLLSLYYTSQRYVSDFLPYLMIASIINIWFLQEYTKYPQLLLKIGKPFFMFTGIISILVGVNFGMFAYGYYYNHYMISQLSIFLFFLIPISLVLSYFTMRLITPVCDYSP